MPYPLYQPNSNPAGLKPFYALNAITAPGNSGPFVDAGRAPTLSYSLTGAGAVSATVVLEVRNINNGIFETAATTTLSGTNTAAGAALAPGRFAEYRVTCSALSAGAELTASVVS